MWLEPLRQMEKVFWGDRRGAWVRLVRVECQRLPVEVREELGQTEGLGLLVVVVKEVLGALLAAQVRLDRLAGRVVVLVHVLLLVVEVV